MLSLMCDHIGTGLDMHRSTMLVNGNGNAWRFLDRELTSHLSPNPQSMLTKSLVLHQKMLTTTAATVPLHCENSATCFSPSRFRVLHVLNSLSISTLAPSWSKTVIRSDSILKNWQWQWHRLQSVLQAPKAIAVD